MKDKIIEELSATLHDIYQTEAHRQEALGLGPARHYDDYEKLSEPVKEFDRVLARFVLSYAADRVKEEREKLAQMVEHWHIKKGGFSTIAHEIRKLTPPEPLPDSPQKDTAPYTHKHQWKSVPSFGGFLDRWECCCGAHSEWGHTPPSDEEDTGRDYIG